ncbi:hypothetical protein [Mucilaginibacter gilvus]|uniref:Outer membrane protein beta-barrel domain-containing protein n=1 Tax=Mucilaginibacter gilvus TaxID=2305909 RepID=A0A3S3URB4_9SPHI|nr:hypothetical protein [Mucilaginibacter gilvus]RWY52484.1 hypothetical protein EPL05_11305 [Mucilaginibacter gilvus]
MKKLNKLLVLAAAILTITSAANAQGMMGKEVSGTMQIQGMYRQSKLGQLSGILNANGIPALPDNNYWLNVSMNHSRKNWIMEDGIGASFMSNSAANTTNGIRAKYNQYQIYGRLGYNVATHEKMRAFPFVGLNLSAAMLNIRDDKRTQNTSDFSTELLNQTASKTLWNPRFGLEFGAGFDYLIGIKDKKIDSYTIHRSLPIGVRFGYYLQASNSNWKIDDNYKLQNGPNNKQSNIFINVNIGLGYKVQRP